MYNFYNIATGIKTTVEILIDHILQSLPFEVSVEYSGSTQGDQFGIFCTYDKIKQALGWEPKTHLKEGITNMVEWALSK